MIIYHHPYLFSGIFYRKIIDEISTLYNFLEEIYYFKRIFFILYALLKLLEQPLSDHTLQPCTKNDKEAQKYCKTEAKVAHHQW